MTGHAEVGGLAWVLNDKYYPVDELSLNESAVVPAITGESINSHVVLQGKELLHSGLCYISDSQFCCNVANGIEQSKSLVLHRLATEMVFKGHHYFKWKAAISVC